jgi:FeS assembly SUF system protein
MKEIPVIQPFAPPPTPPDDTQTASIVNDPERLAALRPKIVEAISKVFDPEIPVNIYDLGLVYTIEISPEGDVAIAVSLTAPGCPVAGEMPGWVENAVSTVQGVQNVTVNMVFDPPWDQSRMSDEARLVLNMW